MSVSEDFMINWNRVVSKYRTDDIYREVLLSYPTDVLRAEGIVLPEGRTVRIVEQAENESVLVLPAAGSLCEAGETEERMAAFGAILPEGWL